MKCKIHIIITTLDYNPAVAAHIFQNRTPSKVCILKILTTYQIKAGAVLYSIQKDLCHSDKSMHLCTTLNYIHAQNVVDNFGKSWGNTAYWMKISWV